MSRRIALFTVIALVVVACGTQPANNPGAHRDPSVGHWLLDSGTDDGEDLPILDSNPITMTLNGSRVMGTAACNSYGGGYTLTADGAFSITDGIAVTEMWCGDEDVMNSEFAYLTALQKVARLEVTGTGLVLTGNGAELRFVPDPDAGPVPPEDTDNGDEPVSDGFFPARVFGSWILVSGESGGRIIPIVDTHPVRLTIGHNSLGGTICNHYGVQEPFPADGSFPEIASTLMACEGPVMDSEAAFLEALSRYESAEIVDGNLVIRGQDTTLTFRPDPDRPGGIGPGGGSTPSPGGPSSDLFPPETHGEWVMVEGELDGAPIRPNADFPALLKISADGVGGKVCNDYGIVFDEDGRPADFDLTRAYCGDAVNELENLFLRTISQGEIAAVDNGRLMIRGPLGYLIFAPA